MKTDRIIELEKIDMKSYEAGYRECFREICDLEKRGDTGKKIERLFKSDGSWAGAVWGQNCAYSGSDLEANGHYVLSHDDRESMIETEKQWEDEVSQELNEAETMNADKMEKSYCTQNDGDCSTCSLVSYGRDCMNNLVAIADDYMKRKKLAGLVAEYAEKNPIPYDAIDLISRIMQDRPMSDGQKRLIVKIQSA